MESIQTGNIRKFNELRYGNKILSDNHIAFPQGAIITSQDITEQKTAELDRIKLIEKLQLALSEVETLRGLLPICACCKKIRDDKGYWNHIEAYLRKHAQDRVHPHLVPRLRQAILSRPLGKNEKRKGKGGYNSSDPDPGLIAQGLVKLHPHMPESTYFSDYQAPGTLHISLLFDPAIPATRPELL